MAILKKATQLHSEVSAWRQHLHSIPELLFDLFKTSSYIEERLREIGVDKIETGIARTGIVALIHGKNGDGPTIGLRADMDALPIVEDSGVAHQSTHPGKMHGCGHDGHSAMLLGAAKYLVQTRNFAGSVALIFQPAEEGGGGGDVMVKEGIMDRYDIAEVYGMHNLPQLNVGKFATRTGPIMAATATFNIVIKGKGGHAAMPQSTIDPIVVGSHIVTGLQTIASRNADPVESIVVSVTQFHAGQAYNVIPEEAQLAGTMRTLKQELADLGRERLYAIVENIASAHGATAEINFNAGYPVTVNHKQQTKFACDAARQVFGDDNVEDQVSAMMGGEDFSYMLLERPGSFVFIGNGNTAGLHHPKFDFNDEIIPYGISYWGQLVESRLAPKH